MAQGREVREMRDADTILTIIRERGGRGLALVVCHECHVGIHRGDLRGHEPRLRVTGEPDAVKAARPVRRGADGKGPS